MKTDVIFRAEGPRGRREITAVFPAIPGTHEYDMTCYAHVGQHSSCSYTWYLGTWPAKPEEYANLLAELSGIYTEGLRVMHKITDKHRQQRKEAMKC